VLKLDCERSEFSILHGTTMPDRIGVIVGEYHGKEAFMDLVKERFACWGFRILRDGDPGTFWLVNPAAPAPPLFALEAHRGNGAAATAEVARARLVLDGKEVPLGAAHTLRRVERPDGPALPTLYLGGRRVTRRWEIELAAAVPADPCGGNANTE
jgi:hypothetical protein